MTQPIVYEFQPPAEIEAMFNNGDAAVVQGIVDWITPLLTSGDSVSIVWTNKIGVTTGAGNFSISPNQYVYLDDDGFHVVDKGPFELLFKVSDGV
jgi:hypothetical protein